MTAIAIAKGLKPEKYVDLLRRALCFGYYRYLLATQTQMNFRRTKSRSRTRSSESILRPKSAWIWVRKAVQGVIIPLKRAAGRKSQKYGFWGMALKIWFKQIYCRSSFFQKTQREIKEQWPRNGSNARVQFWTRQNRNKGQMKSDKRICCNFGKKRRTKNAW